MLEIMKVKKIQLEHIKHIFELYIEHCGLGIVPIKETDHYAQEVLKDLKNKRGENIGMALNGNLIQNFNFPLIKRMRSMYIFATTYIVTLVGKDS